MITGIAAWTTALNSEQKRALYVFAIPGLSINLVSFFPLVFVGVGLNDLRTGGVFPASNSFTIQIDATGTPDTFKWKKDSGGWTTGVAITGLAQTLSDGVTITFAATTGHTLNDEWILDNTLLPILKIPTGASQTIDELTAHSSISTLTITANDPGGQLKALAANQLAIGQIATLSIGFPGLSIAQFVTIHTGRVAKIGRDASGMMVITISDLILDIVNNVFLNGGGYTWTDLATSGAGVAIVTSAKAVFQSWMVGYSLRIISGTNFSAGFYSISSVDSSTQVTLASSPTPGGAGSAGVGVIAPVQPNFSSSVQGGTAKITNGPPIAPAILDNGIPISSDNPRYLLANPLDILLAVLQNELGLGQATPPVLVLSTDGSGTGQAGFGINPLWTLYNINDASTLIDPNLYVDLTSIKALRDGELAGELMEFVITSAQSGRSWIDNQILKPLGLYWITGVDGKLRLKSTKFPPASDVAVRTVTITQNQLIGIPVIDRWPVINIFKVDLPISADPENTTTLNFANQLSLNKYKAPYVATLSSEGLRLVNGGYARLFLLANRIFARHAFGAPVYMITTFLKNLVLELGDFILLTSPIILDLVAGTLGITNVLCEVISREPNYAGGQMAFKVVDTRFMAFPNGSFQIAAIADGIPVWTLASPSQKATYMFITDNTGHYSDSTPGNQID